MSHFHKLQVASIDRQTSDCVAVTLDVPNELKETFGFRHGQSLTFRKIIGGQEVRRTYSICSSPFDNELKVAVKSVPGGLFSNFVNTELKAGEELEVMPPLGRFNTELNPDLARNYVAIAAGSGITPVLSIIKTTLITEPKSSFTLIFGNRSRNSIIFREELEALKNCFLSRFQIIHVLSREQTDVPLHSGRIDRDKLASIFGKLITTSSIDEVFICGPEEMIFTSRDFLQEHGIQPEHIHFELFTTPGQKTAGAVDRPKREAHPGESASVALKLDGITITFPLEYDGPSILDAALEQGADLPYACKGGVCTTCKARLTAGKVEMDVNWGLEPDELAAGYILTCQAHPVTPEISVDFDQK